MQIQDAQDKVLYAHLEDLSSRAANQGWALSSDFLDEREQSLLSRMEGRLLACLFMEGGDENAERKIAVFYPEWMQEEIRETARDMLRVLRIEPADSRFMDKNLSHRDFLGALMGLGVKREKLGDLRIQDGICYAVVKEEIADFLKENLTSVGKAIVNCTVLETSPLPPAAQGMFSVISVSSMRLDSMIGRGFSLSRSDAVKWIRAGHVFKNGSPVMDPDKTVSSGDKLTLRGKGRLVIHEEKGTSRSGRLQVLVERFGK